MLYGIKGISPSAKEAHGTLTIGRLDSYSIDQSPLAPHIPIQDKVDLYSATLHGIGHGLLSSAFNTSLEADSFNNASSFSRFDTFLVDSKNQKLTLNVKRMLQRTPQQ